MAKPQFPRRFVVPSDILDNWSTIEPYFQHLRERRLESPNAAAKWLEDYSELLAAIDEIGTDRYVKMTCQTDDPARKAAFLDFIENIEPKCKPACHELNVKYVNTRAGRDLPMERYGVLDRRVRASVEIFREPNVPLQTEESKVVQKYQEVGGAQTVMFDGREQTIQQLAIYAERTDRAIRQQAWETEAGRRGKDIDALEDIFDQLVRLRHRMAVNADCRDFREYAFKAKQRFDYTPNDCIAFHDAVEKASVPVLRAMQRERQSALGLDHLRPWDLSVDVKGRSPLKPFSSAEELCEKSSRIFHRVDPELGKQFDDMRRHGFLDLESRKGKAPGGYQSNYDESRHPFIFMNAVGVQRDVRTMIHEGGHAFHTYAARNDPLVQYRSSPIEFAEVASFGMEMLALDFLGEFYTSEELARAKRAQLEGIISLFPWVATIDAFQHWIYTHPDHSRAERKAYWLELHDRFGGVADYSGYERTLECAWHKQLHIFEVPFYYIEYGIAKLGALQVWQQAMKDRRAATKAYRKALALGGSRSLPELFAAAGAQFEFSHATIAPLMERVQSELAKLPQ